MRNWKVFSGAILLFLMPIACASENGDEADPGLATAPVIVSQSDTGMSIAASSAVFSRIGVMNWEVEGNEKSLHVRGFGDDTNPVLDMLFEHNADGSVTVVDRNAVAVRIIDAQGNSVKDEFSKTAQQQFDALSLDATAIRQMTAAKKGNNLRTQTIWDDVVCTRCYGVVEFCGNLELNDTGIAECTNLERCGWCIGLWW